MAVAEDLGTGWTLGLGRSADGGQQRCTRAVPSIGSQTLAFRSNGVSLRRRKSLEPAQYPVRLRERPGACCRNVTSHSVTVGRTPDGLRPFDGDMTEVWAQDHRRAAVAEALSRPGATLLVAFVTLISVLPETPAQPPPPPAAADRLAKDLQDPGLSPELNRPGRTVTTWHRRAHISNRHAARVTNAPTENGSTRCSS